MLLGMTKSEYAEYKNIMYSTLLKYEYGKIKIIKI